MPFMQHLNKKRPVILQRRGELKREDWGERSVDMFERLEVIGEGTYGKVFKARDTKTQQLVALKSVKLENEKELVARPGPEKYNYKLTTFDVKAPIFGKEKKNNPLK